MLSVLQYSSPVSGSVAHVVVGAADLVRIKAMLPEHLECVRGRLVGDAIVLENLISKYLFSQAGKADEHNAPAATEPQGPTE